MQIARALAELKEWMVSHGARAIVENLAPGASAEHLDRIEAELGFSLGDELRALWSLHDGQRREGDGFISSWDLLRSEEAIADRVRRRTLGPVRFLREHPTSKSGLTVEEQRSDAWVAFAMRDSDGYVVSTESGRVFAIAHDDYPPLVLATASISDWARRYADEVRSGAYRVEHGFGGIYLALGGTELDEDPDEEEQQRVERRLSMSASELVSQAIAHKNPHEVMDFLKLARERSPSAFEEAIERLFVGEASPAFIARALQPLLQAVTLSPDRWRVVAAGAEQNGNAAARDFAKRKISGS